ncbi:PREDICTED: deoxynucleotidyltransferase terminal-interacting protein 2 [Chinchilla lanigera]|uniref:Deoxynucleotidyltransferase terminal interacting protein 2 n=1 Tax=Chinchilla lanigera TaxID=34839 RepID=A0A8C2V3V6_CHILA|nr:PREDICTED: deoxynucleotidyltransferase terminal-interacting protein 2 [Chinchilla lanigera]
MVVTRSARSQATIQVTSASSRQQKSSAGGIQAHPESRKESGPDNQITADSQTAGKQSSISRIPKTKKRKSRTTAGSLAEITEPSTDGEFSETESNCSSVSEIQEPILRITRRRQIIIAPTPVSTVRKKQKITQLNDSVAEEIVSEAESHASGISKIVPSPEMTRTRSKAKSLTGQSQESHAEAVSDAESSCSDISFPGITHKRTTRIMPRKLQAQADNKYTKIIPENKKGIMDISMKSEDSHPRPSLDEEENRVIDERKENDKSSQLKCLSKLQDTSLQQFVFQKHSTPQNNKATSESSNLNCEAVMKSLAQTFAVVAVNRWNEERKSTVKTNDLTKFSGHGGDDEESTSKVSEDNNSERSVGLECDTKLNKSELNQSQDIDDSVLLVLSSDESPQSENGESEEDTVCFVENSDQKESLNGNSENTSHDNAFFVIDTTPGLNADKNFYLEDKASEVTTEEGKEEEEDESSEEEPSDSDRNKDEYSDEDDLLNNTKSKLLKLTSSSIDPGLSIKELGGVYINFNAEKLQSKKKTLTQIKEKKKNELLQKAVITPDFEKNDCVPPYSESKRQLQKKRRKERQKTAGDGWFGMKAPELTDELKNDLKALKMRASMDPKRFYKKNDRDGFPKYFQIGTIVDNPADFYHSRIPKKQRKRTIVEELLADSEFRRYNRRKYLEIMSEKAANAAGKKFRKKKKFRN